ncbi:MAG: FAD-dependent oxidoreductase, partial [Chloroflexi bacterium]|nr:FAD-dependent oxidoreductase [Chloroflexota bacterium]
VVGATATDELTGGALEIRARVTVNATGPWTECVMDLLGESRPRNRTTFASASNLVSRKQIVESYAAGVSGKGGRFLFIAPWRRHSLLGTSYSAYSGHPDGFEASFRDAEALLQGFNDALPSSRLLDEDISFVHGGLLPLSDALTSDEELRLAKRHQIHDHRRERITGLISVLGVKYTTARHVAEKVVDGVLEAQGYMPPKSLSAKTLLNGGELFHVQSLQELQEIVPYRTFGHLPGATSGQMRQLISNYGSEYPEVLKLLDAASDETGRDLDDMDVLKAQTRYAVRFEMAQRLDDIVFRRTELGTAGHPGREALRVCAQTAGQELGWSADRIEQEIHRVEDRFSLVSGGRS